MPLDRQVETILQAMRDAGRPETHTLAPAMAREAYQQMALALGGEIRAVHNVEDLNLPGPAGEIPIRLYRPRALANGERLGVLVFFHGGGWVIGDLETHDQVCRWLCAEADCIVVAIDYRLGPEHPFPAAVEDCYAAVAWVAENAAALGADSSRMAVGGDSAGGNLAAVVALLARDCGGPEICLQLLIYPATAAEPNSRSHQQFGEGLVLTRETIRYFYGHYLTDKAQRHDWRLAPLEAADLSHLPAAEIIVAGYDPLRDEGVEYASRLIEAGNRVRLTNFSGMVHAFIQMPGVVDVSRQALRQCAGAMRDAFGA